MSDNKKYTFRKILVISVWILLGSGTIVLLVAAITRKNNEQITGIEINISGVQNNYFIDKKEVLKILEKTNGKSLQKAIVSSLDLTEMENALQKDQWIKKAEMFFDNNIVLQIKIAEREPVARIFTASGASFYLDSSWTRLPLSDKFSARLPVFTNFPTDVIVLSKEDSILLNEIKSLSEFIGNDPFWMAQIDQIDITPERTFELVPKLGNQVIGVNRNAQEIKMDSLRAIEIMKKIIVDAQKSTNDSTNVQLSQPEDDNSNINNSHEIENVPDENAGKAQINEEKNKISGSVTPIHVPEKPTFKKTEPVETKPLITHPSSHEKPSPTWVKKAGAKKEVLKKQEEKIKQVPKAVMPPKSDY